MTQENSLSPRHYGAEALVKVASSRRCGILRWRDGRNGADLLFVSGRPQRFIDEGGQEIEDRDIVVSAFKNHRSCIHWEPIPLKPWISRR